MREEPGVSSSPMIDRLAREVALYNDLLREVLDCTVNTPEHPERWHIAAGKGPRFASVIREIRYTLDGIEEPDEAF